MDLDVFEELSRKLALVEARLASYERLHTEEISELRSLLQELKMRQATLASRAANDAARLESRDGQSFPSISPRQEQPPAESDSAE
ncbi:MAG TPA: hypothetical protein VK879_17280 [Candidatus Sulfomarinibacteraceae bacterium]|nr:hypothetical protein [Candidatus Sulfomarinibacteraceae bacterium]